VQFESLGAVFYSLSIVTVAVSVVVCEIFKISHKRLQIWPSYLASKTGVTLKTGLGFVQGHWKWHHLIDRVRVPIHLP